MNVIRYATERLRLVMESPSRYIRLAIVTNQSIIGNAADTG
jgi:hypothetical protein